MVTRALSARQHAQMGCLFLTLNNAVFSILKGPNLVLVDGLKGQEMCDDRMTLKLVTRLLGRHFELTEFW